VKDPWLFGKNQPRHVEDDPAISSHVYMARSMHTESENDDIINRAKLVP